MLHQLTTPPSIYCAVVDAITSNTLDDHQCSFQHVFKMLARKGVFLDECDDTIVTEAALATVHPFNIVSLLTYCYAWVPEISTCLDPLNARVLENAILCFGQKINLILHGLPCVLIITNAVSQ